MAAKKAKKKVQIFPIVNTIIMILFVIITLYPVLNTLAISLNDGTDSLRGGIYLLPRKFTWKNYITVLQKDNLITGAYVTVARTVIGTVLAADLQCNPSLSSAEKGLCLKAALFILGYHPVCKRRSDPDIPVVQGTGTYQQLLGICYPWNGQCV